MLEQEFTIVNRLGLHARAAAVLVRAANGFASQIRIQKNTQPAVDAKSIMSVMLLAAAKNAQVCLTIEGEDEQEAMQKLGTLIQSGFGEGE